MVGELEYTVGDLPPIASPSREHFFVVFKDNLTGRLTVGQALDLLIDSAPGALDTLNELAAALGDDPNFATTIAALIGTKVDATAFSDALAKRLRVDAAQSFTGAEKSQGIANLVDGPLCGFRNKLMNPRFNINQSAASASVSLAANAHWYDGWKAGAGGCTLSEVAGVVSITAGTLVQIIEGTDVETGAHVINWTGTATCAVDGVAKTKGATFTLTRGTNCTVSFGTGTLSFPQIEPGNTATAFEQRPKPVEIDLCQWRYEEAYAGIRGYQPVAGAAFRSTIYFKTKRISSPIVSGIAVLSSSNVNSAAYLDVYAGSAALQVIGTSGGAGTVEYTAKVSIDARL